MKYRYLYTGRDLNQFPGGGIGCLVFSVLLLVGAYYLLQGLYYLLLWAAPALLVLALIINWRVFPDTLKNWFRSLETNPLGALLALALAALLFPFFSFYLFLKALGYRKMEQLRRQFDGVENLREDEGFVEFEELESTPKRDVDEQDEMPEIPAKPEAPRPKKDQNPYDSFFN